MDWAQKHIYSLVAVAIVALLLGILTLWRPEPVQQPQGFRFSAVTGGSYEVPTYGIFEEDAILPRRTNAVVEHATSTTSFSYWYPVSFTSPAANSNEPLTAPVFTASQQKTSVSEAQTPTLPQTILAYAYSFIPRGIISPNIKTKKARTPEQEALFNYGNEAGLLILSFDNAHTDMTSILSAFFEPSTRTAAEPKLFSLGTAYQELGASIRVVPNVPESIRKLGTSLADSYIQVGTGLQKLSKASGDQALLAAITAYDASAEEHIRSFIAVATFFSAQGVTFSEANPGSVFTFPQSGGF